MPRPRTHWDVVMEDAMFASRMLQERRKLKVATLANLTRQLKGQVQRTQLRIEEQYHFHRLTSTYLTEAVLQTFKKTAEVAVPQMMEQKVEEKQEGPKKHQDDIFMNQEEYSYLPEQPDLLDDLLAVDGGDAPNRPDDQTPPLQIEPVSVYVSVKFAERRDAIENEPVVGVSRKGTLKRINENVRKRLKYKEEEEEQVGRSLSSATVFLSNLLNTEEETRASLLSEPLNTSEWLFVGQRPRKRKEEEGVDLRWSIEEMEKMEQRNQKNGFKKGKVDSGVLMLTLAQSEEQYRKAFQKQIAGDKSFPPTLRNIPDAQAQRPTKYYNEFHDREYETFVMKYNKKRLFQNFSQKASMIFPQNYSQDDVQDAQNISTGRLFIYKPQKLLKRVVFLKEERAVRTYLRSQPRNCIDEPRALLLAFLVERYLREFGNNWKNISQLICRHIAFAHKHVTVEFVQQIYQMVARLAEGTKNIPSLQLWDKRILPYSCSNTQSYTSFHPHGQSNNKTSSNTVPASPFVSDNKTNDIPITTEYYKDLLAEEVTEVDESPYQIFQHQFQQFLKPYLDNLGQLKTSSADKQDNLKQISQILEKYQEGKVTIVYDVEDEYSDEISASRHQILTENLKGQIKVGTPFRKKKSINQRNNELVKILQALRNKTAPPTNPLQKKPQDTIKPNGQLPPQKIAPVPAPTIPKPPIDAASVATDIKKTTMKSPQKPDKKLGAPSKKDKKSKEDEKK